MKSVGLLVLTCLLFAATYAGNLRRLDELSHERSWVMLPDDHGEPTLALLKGNPPKAKPIDLNRDVEFHLYTSSNPVQSQRLYLNDIASLQASFLNPSNPTKIVTHGFTNTLESEAIQTLKDAFLNVGSYNVIGVDWGVLAEGPWYNVAKDNSALVGNHLGHMIDFLSKEGGVQLSDLHLIGHSLGAHISGIAANTAVGIVARATGLDPALPLFADEIDILRLDANDAAYVDVIHTCGGWLGFMDPIGDADFYPNGGVTVQPGCGLIDTTGSCSHAKSHELFAASITNPDGYPAYECTSVTDAEVGNCGSFTAGLMGLGSDPTMKGIFHLKTK